jgi:hypothetical protein
MSAKTLVDLEAAVDAHNADVQGDENPGHVTSWAVVYETRRLTEEGELMYATSYAASEGSPHLAASMLAWGSATILETIYGDDDVE